MTLLEVKNLKKIYTTRFGGNQVQALSNVNFSVEEKEYVAIMGESGSGKTTLLNILAALDKPTSGKVYLKGRDLGEIRNKEMAAFRRQNLGFVFQDFNLLDTFSVQDNIFCRWFFPAKAMKKCQGALSLSHKSLESARSLGNFLMRSLADKSRGRRSQEPSSQNRSWSLQTNPQERWIPGHRMNFLGCLLRLTGMGRRF